jgi:GGDEF domain-containing protein
MPRPANPRTRRKAPHAVPQRAKRVREAIPADRVDHEVDALAIGEGPDFVEKSADIYDLVCSYGPGQFGLLLSGYDRDDARAVCRGHLARRAPHSTRGSVDEDDLAGA